VTLAKQALVNIKTDRHHPLPAGFGRIARFAFFATLILLPFRWRIELLARPKEPLYGDYTDFLLFLPDITLVVMLLAWGLALWTDRKPVRFGPALVWIPLAGLTFAGLLSAVFSVDRALSLYHAVRFSFLFLFYLYVVNEKISIFEVGLAVGLQGLIQSIAAVGQSLTQRSLGLQALGEYALDPSWAGVSIVSNGVDRFLRAYGLADHPNILGGCLAFGMVILLGIILHGDKKYTVPGAAVFVLMSAALLLTFSRAAWLAFLAGSGLMVGLEAWLRRRETFRSAMRLAVVAFVILIPLFFMQRSFLGARLNVGNSFAEIRAEAQSMDERVFLNESANRIFVKHPLIGVGLSAAPVAMKIEFPEFPTYYQPPHFTLLTAALETGIFGAAFYFLLLVLPWTIFLRRRDLWANSNAVGAAGLLLAVTVVGFFDYYTWFSTAGRLWQWLAWGLFAVAITPLPVGVGLGVREN
jgi:O-antigen ligase